jgi:hypothetical protein
MLSRSTLLSSRNPAQHGYIQKSSTGTFASAKVLETFFPIKEEAWLRNRGVAASTAGK